MRNISAKALSSERRSACPSGRRAFTTNLDEIFFQSILTGPHVRSTLLRKVLFWGERVGEISSYVAGWMVGKGIDVIVLDGANRFNPYVASSFARKALIPPERLLKRIRIARAFTCYQMATLMGKQLGLFLRQGGAVAKTQKPWVIILGPITTFLDEDVHEREARSLFERSLRKLEGLAMGGIPFFLFQSSVSSKNSPFTKEGRRRPEPDYGAGCSVGLMDSKKVYLTRKLFEFSNLVWRIDLDDEGPRFVLEKEITFTKSLSHSVIGHSMT
jgi:hypothetical protein